MAISSLSGIITRRILLSYQSDAAVVAAFLPAPLRPRLVRGKALAGISLIRLENLRPKGLPWFTGLSSENCAHRIAVEWTDDTGRLRKGVFVMRRDSDSAINALLGGRLFPGTQNLSLFSVQDWGNSLRIRVDADEYLQPLVELDAESCDALPPGSVFESLEEASAFQEDGCVAYSLSDDARSLEGLRMDVEPWRAVPLKVFGVRSVCFDDPRLFPPGGIRFDHALIVRDIAHSWHLLPAWKCGGEAVCRFS